MEFITEKFTGPLGVLLQLIEKEELDITEIALATIPGAPPALDQPIPGCAFAPRCPFKIERCEVERPEFFSIGVGHRAACHLTASGAVAP